MIFINKIVILLAGNCAGPERFVELKSISGAGPRYPAKSAVVLPFPASLKSGAVMAVAALFAGAGCSLQSFWCGFLLMRGIRTAGRKHWRRHQWILVIETDAGGMWRRFACVKTTVMNEWDIDLALLRNVDATERPP